MRRILTCVGFLFTWASPLPAAQLRVELRQVVHRVERIGMVLAEHRTPLLERLGVKRLGLLVAALTQVQARQAVQRTERRGTRPPSSASPKSR